MPDISHKPPTQCTSLLLLERQARSMRLLRACLERMGYRVLTSSSAEWTREMLEAPEIDLLIASISREEEGEHWTLLESVLDNRPLLFVEAEPGTGLAHELQQDHHIHYLARPFTLDELDRKIKEALRSIRK